MSKFLAIRNTMWDNILDNISVHAEALLLQKDDVETLDILLGRECSDVFVDNECNIATLAVVGNYLVTIFKRLGLI